MLEALKSGKLPHVPLDRGLNQLDVDCLPAISVPLAVHLASNTKEDGELDSNTSSDSSSSSSSSPRSSAAPSDDVSCESDLEDAPGRSGVWIVNATSGVVHKAVAMEDGQWVLACRPSAHMHEGYIRWSQQPSGFTPCEHNGCPAAFH